MTDVIHVIDSHTAGEPTRVVIDGGPDLGDGPLSERLDRFQVDHDAYRSAVVMEPRGSDVLVGALLCKPSDPSCQAGVIFFNNVGYLGMCGHGMIGVVETLRSLGRISTGRCDIETPVGSVAVEVESDGAISITNVDSYRLASDVKVDADGVGTVVGDVAWGGNWFFLAQEPRQTLRLDVVPELINIASSIRLAVNQSGYSKVNHVELFGEPEHPDADSRNFVLCPGGQYDRSPCGTGTSAKLACLAADGKLDPGEEWVQEGILGTSFTGSYEWADPSREKIRPKIKGRAFITAEAHLKLSGQDPFCWGIRGPLS